MAERFRFVGDDDGHDYLIPAAKKEAFDKWLEHQFALWGEPLSEEDFKAISESYKGEDFNGYRCSDPERYTFENPEVG